MTVSNELIDRVLADYKKHEDLIGENGLLKQLALLRAGPSKSLHRMLSPTGNPSIDNLAAIFQAIRDRLQVNYSVTATVGCEKPLRASIR